MNSFPIEPIGNKLVVEPISTETKKTDGGIYAVSNAELHEGKVVAVSKSIESLFSIGDIVLYPEKKGNAHVIDGKTYLWLDCTLEKEEIWGKNIK